MNTRKHILLAVAVVLLASFGTAMAQRKMDQKGSALRLPPEPIGSVVNVNAIEVTDGTMGYSETKEQTMFGYSFLGRTTGSLPGSFTLSMNCTPAVPMPSDTSQLTGGSWTLPVYMTDIKSSGYAGSIYGTIAKGTMIWDKTGTQATMYIVLNVDGGTQSWDGVTGYATFTGTLTAGEKGQKTTLNGNMVFNLISPIFE